MNRLTNARTLTRRLKSDLTHIRKQRRELALREVAHADQGQKSQIGHRQYMEGIKTESVDVRTGPRRG